MRQLYASMMRWSGTAAALIAFLHAPSAEACPIRVGTVETKFVANKRVLLKRVVEKVLKPAFQDWDGPSYVDVFDWRSSIKSPWQVGPASTSNPERYKPLRLDLVLEIDEGLAENETSVYISYWKTKQYEKLLDLEDLPVRRLEKLGAEPKLQKHLAGLRKRCNKSAS